MENAHVNVTSNNGKTHIKDKSKREIVSIENNCKLR